MVRCNSIFQRSETYKETILSTCAPLIDALNTVASYVTPTDPNLIADLSGQIAVVSPIPSTETELQLSAGGIAILSFPSSQAHGVRFRVVGSGLITSFTNSYANATITLHVGTSLTSSLASIMSVSPSAEPNSTRGFVFDADMFFDATSSGLHGLSDYTNSSGFNQISTILTSSLTSLNLFLSINGGNRDSLSVTQFKVQLV